MKGTPRASDGDSGQKIWRAATVPAGAVLPQVLHPAPELDATGLRCGQGGLSTAALMNDAADMAPTLVQLRPASQADVPALVRLFQRTWLVSWAPEVPFEAVQIFASYNPAKAHAEEGWPFFTIATLDGALLGMSHVEGNAVEDLHVDPKAWGQGIGAKLMDDAEAGIAHSHAYARLDPLRSSA